MLNLPRLALAAVGRHASLAYALSIVIGLAMPQLASLLRPAIPVTIFIFIVLAFMRAHLPGLRLVAAAPGRLVYAIAVSAIIPPLIGWIVLHLPFTAGFDPGLRLALALMAAAPPLMASPVYAALLGLENSFALTALVLGMVLTPFTAPLVASILAGSEVPISPWDLAERLALFIGLGMLTGFILRRLVGQPRILALKNELDGLSVAMFFFFAVAAMDGVLAEIIARPMRVLGFLALSTSLAIIGFALGYAALGRFAFNDRFSVAICIGLRNMGLLVAPILALLEQTTFLYFALAQVPIYFAPLMLKALVARLRPVPPLRDNP